MNNNCKLVNELCKKCNKCESCEKEQNNCNTEISLTTENMEKLKLQLGCIAKLLVVFGVAFLVLFSTFMRNQDAQTTIALILPTCCFWIFYLSWQYVDTMKVFSLKHSSISAQNQEWYEYISKAMPISILLTICLSFIISGYGTYYDVFNMENIDILYIWGTGIVGTITITILIYWQQVYKKHIWIILYEEVI